MNQEALNSEFLEAAFENNIDRCLIFIKKGADVNYKDKNNHRPLHAAVRNDNPEMVKLFIRLGADVNINTKFGTSPLHLSASKNDIVISKILLDSQADVNIKGRNEMSPLHTASYNSNLDACKLLIEYGANIFSKDKYGRTPYDRCSDEFQNVWDTNKLNSLFYKKENKTLTSITEKEKKTLKNKRCSRL